MWRYNGIASGFNAGQGPGLTHSILYPSASLFLVADLFKVRYDSATFGIACLQGGRYGKPPEQIRQERYDALQNRDSIGNSARSQWKAQTDRHHDPEGSGRIEGWFRA